MEGGEFQDWELLVTSDSDVGDSPKSVVEGCRDVDGTEANSRGMIRLDYFSLESNEMSSKEVAVDGSSVEEGCVESENPSWIDPAPETQFRASDAAGFWSDLGSDLSDGHKFSNYAARNELGFVGSKKTGVGFGQIEDDEAKLKAEEDQICTFGGNHEMGFEENVKAQMSIEGFGETPTENKDLAESWSDSGGDGMALTDVEQVNEVSVMLKELDDANVLEDDNTGADEIAERKTIADSEAEKKQVVWWKVPFEVFKYYVLRASPVWSFSMAAALMGFVILGRRLYKMKRKTRTLHLKVTVDDKKVSQVMSRADRLNEAFSVVRRVPIIRPLLPAAGANSSWPMMSMR